jgi:hypothetical protein
MEGSVIGLLYGIIPLLEILRKATLNLKQSEVQICLLGCTAV